MLLGAVLLIHHRPPVLSQSKHKVAQISGLINLRMSKSLNPISRQCAQKYHLLLLYSVIHVMDQEISVIPLPRQAPPRLAKSMSAALLPHVAPLVIVAVADLHALAPQVNVRQGHAHVSLWKAVQDADPLSLLIPVNQGEVLPEANRKCPGRQL